MPRRARSGPGIVRRIQGSAANGAPVVTYAIIAICVVVWVLEVLPVVGDYVYAYGAYAPGYGYTVSMPWTMITSAFLHSPSSILHLLLNMVSLYFIGPALESMLGKARYLVLYLVAAFGGSVAVLLLAPASVVVGASGAIFGMMAGYFIIARRLGGNATQILVVIVANLAFGFFVSSISWQAHIGGLIAGGLVALVFTMTRNRSQRRLQIAGVAGIVVLLLAATVARVAIG
jgi:membrane associated rhomboid family serine protease